MSQPFVGEIRMFGGNFAPAGWAFCNGQLLEISENVTLFNLIGTTYGGDGQNTFALPDLRERVPVHMGQGPGLSNYVIGQNGGVEIVTVIFANHRYQILEVELRRTGADVLSESAKAVIDIGRPALDWVRLAEGMGVEDHSLV